MEHTALILDLLEWVAESPRTYQEVMEAWRTSCPRLTIWEDTVDAGFVRIKSGGESTRFVCVTPLGLAFLHANGRSEAGSARSA